MVLTWRPNGLIIFFLLFGSYGRSNHNGLQKFSFRLGIRSEDYVCRAFLINRAFGKHYRITRDRPLWRQKTDLWFQQKGIFLSQSKWSALKNERRKQKNPSLQFWKNLFKNLAVDVSITFVTHSNAVPHWLTEHSWNSPASLRW